VASWALLRQLYSPFAVCRSTLFEAWSLVRLYGPSPLHVGIWAAFNTLVLVLQLLHTYWFVFLLQKIKVKLVVTISIKVVDRRPGVELPDTGHRRSASEDGREAQEFSRPMRIKARVVETLLEED